MRVMDEEGLCRIERRRRRRKGGSGGEMRSRMEVGLVSFDFSVERREDSVGGRESELSRAERRAKEKRQRWERGRTEGRREIVSSRCFVRSAIQERERRAENSLERWMG